MLNEIAQWVGYAVLFFMAMMAGVEFIEFVCEVKEFVAYEKNPHKRTLLHEELEQELVQSGYLVSAAPRAQDAESRPRRKDLPLGPS
jgi:hypothetical protein